MPYTAFLHNRIELRIEQGRFAEALADIIDGIATLKMLGDDDAILFHHLWAEVDFLTGKTEDAVSRLEDTIKRAQGQQSPYARQLQEMYAHLAIYRIFAGRIDSAYEAGRRAIGVTRNVGDESRAIAAYAMALLAVFRGQVPRAARLLGALDARHAKLSDGEIFSGPIKGRTHALLTEQLGKALAPEELGHLIAEGETLSFDTALTEASLV
jgi:ATP/maltotriose-dependent transcriptional regulator MalT